MPWLHPITTWSRCHGTGIIMAIGLSNGLAKFPLTMRKMAFVTEFAAFGRIIFVA
jgi:hypothetical protein